MWIFFSTADGDGVRGKEDGIAHIVMIPDGVIMTESRLFTIKYPRAGKRTTSSTVGKATNGITKECPILKSKKTGISGKKTNTGKSTIIGAFRI